jgi:hypothetical protein
LFSKPEVCMESSAREKGRDGSPSRPHGKKVGTDRRAVRSILRCGIGFLSFRHVSSVIPNTAFTSL